MSSEPQPFDADEMGLGAPVDGPVGGSRRRRRGPKKSRGARKTRRSRGTRRSRRSRRSRK